MPLVKSASKEAVGENIKIEMEARKSQQQAIAIALAEQRAIKDHADARMKTKYGKKK